MNFDYLVIGAGVVGLSISRELKMRFPTASVAVLEKESEVGTHASGRNSGVLHAGFYYSPDSLKAKLTVDGNRELRAFCAEMGVEVVSCGKVVVAQSPDQIETLKTLHSRGLQNGATVELVSDQELQRIEPLAETHEIALWSPNTGVASPAKVIEALLSSNQSLGVQILTDSKVKHLESNSVQLTDGRRISFGHVVNASGLYSDRIAHMQGFGEKYTMLPFIGLYHYAPSLKGSLKAHIYPTPDPRNPFLGVHYTRTADGSVKVGPTAIPILSREQYSAFENLKTRDALEILLSYPKFALSGHHDVWSLVKTELPKLSRQHLLTQAEKLTSKIDISAFTVSGKPGIRAQLFDKRAGKLEMDFVVEGDASSTHVLNAVSPGWTTCISFAKYVVDGLVIRQAS